MQRILKEEKQSRSLQKHPERSQTYRNVAKRKQFSEIVRQLYKPKISLRKKFEIEEKIEGIKTDPFLIREKRRKPSEWSGLKSRNFDESHLHDSILPDEVLSHYQTQDENIQLRDKGLLSPLVQQ